MTRQQVLDKIIIDLLNEFNEREQQAKNTNKGYFIVGGYQVLLLFDYTHGDYEYKLRKVVK